VSTTTYSPQKHAADVADLAAVTASLLREHAWTRGEITALRADVRRLLVLQAQSAEPDGALDGLIEAAFVTMGGRTWVASELAGRSLSVDGPGLQLHAAIAATGKAATRALGRYLAAQVPGAGYLTQGGLELRRSGHCENMLAWHIVQV